MANGNLTEEDIYEAFAHLYKTTTFTKYQSFQFKLLHRILVTNEDLHKWKLKDTALCNFCEEEIETTVHLFLECEVTKLFWKELEDWLYRNNNIRVKIQPSEIILGNLNIENNLFDLVYLVGKQYVYACRCTEGFPTLTNFLKTLKHVYNIEKYIAINNDNITPFNSKWESIQWNL